jgi:hypothetical protein
MINTWKAVAVADFGLLSLKQIAEKKENHSPTW